MSDIKMSDVFKLPVKVADIRFSGSSHVGSNDDEDDAATIAINAYDANQEEIALQNAQLTDAYNEIKALKAQVDGYQKRVCQMCDGHGMIGNILDSINCPECESKLNDVMADAVDKTTHEMLEAVVIPDASPVKQGYYKAAIRHVRQFLNGKAQQLRNSHE